MEALKAILSPRLDDLPSPASSPEVWEQLWSAYTGPWFGLLAMAATRAAADPAAVAAVLAGTVGLSADPAADPCSSDDEVMCGICGVTFASAGGCATHRVRQHPETAAGPRMLRQSVVGTSCPVCGRDYRHRLRVLHHLRERRGRADGPCRVEVLSGCQRHPLGGVGRGGGPGRQTSSPHLPPARPTHPCRSTVPGRRGCVKTCEVGGMALGGSCLARLLEFRPPALLPQHPHNSLPL